MSSALPLAVPSACGMSNSTMSPRSFWPASRARVPPICPAPISAIFLRAMRKSPFLKAARGSAIPTERQERAGSHGMPGDMGEHQLGRLLRGLVHYEMPDTGQHLQAIGRGYELGGAARRV